MKFYIKSFFNIDVNSNYLIDASTVQQNFINNGYQLYEASSKETTVTVTFPHEYNNPRRSVQ